MRLGPMQPIVGCNFARRRVGFAINEKCASYIILVRIEPRHSVEGRRAVVAPTPAKVSVGDRIDQSARANAMLLTMCDTVAYFVYDFATIMMCDDCGRVNKRTVVRAGQWP